MGEGEVGEGEVKWKGGCIVCLYVCLCMYVCVCMCVYDDLSAYLTKGTFSRFLSLLFLFIYLANQSTNLPTYLTYLTFYLEILFSLIFEESFFQEGL